MRELFRDAQSNESIYSEIPFFHDIDHGLDCGAIFDGRFLEGSEWGDWDCEDLVERFERLGQAPRGRSMERGNQRGNGSEETLFEGKEGDGEGKGT